VGLAARKGAKYLDWYKRLEISVQIARGLDYLHSFADPPVIHRDVKPSNILLDENLVAKVSDFGISRETPEFFSHVTTRLAGTAGYIDPQYYMKRQLTPASDVYSYGVVLLELITGQRAINENNQGDELNNLVQWVHTYIHTCACQPVSLKFGATYMMSYKPSRVKSLGAMMMELMNPRIYCFE
jgi:serine/threonine protein kinase